MEMKEEEEEKEEDVKNVKAEDAADAAAKEDDDVEGMQKRSPPSTWQHRIFHSITSDVHRKKFSRKDGGREERRNGIKKE